jgi:RNA polymerase sigma-70 factor (ECF subfamily)
MGASSISDKELVIELKSGSEKAFNQLFCRYNKRLYAFSFKILLSGEDAEEVVQEVFYKVWKSKRLLKEDMSFKAFVFTVARNHIYNLLSKRVSETAYQNYSTGAIQNQNNCTEDSYNFQELENIVQQMVEKMPDKRKKVFTMSRYDGLTNKEIANQLNLSLSTVENHLNKALKMLKQCLHLHKIGLFVLFMLLA